MLRHSIKNAIATYDAEPEAATIRGAGTDDQERGRRLHALKRMDKKLHVDLNGSLIDDRGFFFFFDALGSLRDVADPPIQQIAENVNYAFGFSFLYPPSPAKPNLIVIPGAGGEPMYRGHVLGFFADARERYNLIGYAFDPTSRLTDLRKRLVEDFGAGHLNASKNLIVTMSYGNTLMHSAILYAIESGRQDIFARSYVLSLGFVVAGAVTYFKSPEWVPDALTPVVRPWSWVPGAVSPFVGKFRGLIEAMNPRNPEHSAIAQNITAIREATAGIFYLQANHDPYVDLTTTEDPYARNRDLILKSLDPDHLRYVTPPPAAVLQNQESAHHNILFAPEVKELIRDFLSLLREEASVRRYVNRSRSVRAFAAPHRDRECERRARTELARDPDLPAVRLDELPAER